MPVTALTNPPRVLLVGGFCETIELCQACGSEIAGILDIIEVDQISGIPVLGDDEAARDLPADLQNLPVVVCPDLPTLRKKLTEYYASLGFNAATMVHPRATVSPSATIGVGVILDLGSNVSANVVLEDGVVLNVGANVMHDSRVGRFTTIAPNAVVLGRVCVGSMAYVGSNSTLLPSVDVGDDAIVGAGAVVTRNVPVGTTVIGSPARPMG